MSNVKLMMHMKATMQLLMKNQEEFTILSILITLTKMHCHEIAIWSGYILSGPAGPIMSNINGPPGPFMLS